MTGGFPSAAYDYQSEGGALHIGSPTYVVRKADGELFAALMAGNLCYVLNARQMGKSSLKVRTIQRLEQEGVACGAVDLQRIGISGTEEQWYLSIINQIVRSLHLRQQFNPDSWWNEHKLLTNVQRFSLFLETVLLPAKKSKIVIFIDEVDSTLQLPFNSDDFFGVLRECYNRRANDVEFGRLTFALIGVATPADLIQNKQLPPFNVGKAIDLTGFQLEEAYPLLPGLEEKSSNPQVLLQALLTWTGGQPFLTQRVRKLILNANSAPVIGQEAQWVRDLVQTHVIDNWEAQDTQLHLRSISRRLLDTEAKVGRRLGLYQQILHEGGIPAKDNQDQLELWLSGIAVKQNGRLQVYNPIYREIFSEQWVEQSLANLRPYAEPFQIWIDSGKQDTSRLLRGQALKDALAWKAGRSLSPQDDDFLDASQAEERKSIQQRLDAETEAKRILENARKRSAVLFAFAMVVAIGSVVGSLLFLKRARHEINGLRSEQQGLQQALKEADRTLAEADSKLIDATNKLKATNRELATKNREVELAAERVRSANQNRVAAQLAVVVARREQQRAFVAREEALAERNQALMSRAFAEQQRTIAQVATQLEQKSSRVLRSFASVFVASNNSPPIWRIGQINSLIASIRIGHDFKRISQGLPINQYPTFGPIFTLQQILYNISEKNYFEHNARVFNAIFSANGREILTASEDGTAILWSRSGEKIRTFLAGANIRSASLSPDGRFILAGTNTGKVILWDRRSDEKKEFIYPGSGEIRSLSFNQRGDRILAASDDKVARLWSVADESQPLQEYTHNHPISSVSFSPDDQQILTTSGNQAILWAQQGRELKTFTHTASINSASFSRDGQRIVIASNDKSATIWNLNDSKPSLSLQHLSEVQVARFSPNGDRLLTGTLDGQAILWDIQERKELQRFEHDLVTQRSDDIARIYDLNFSPRGDEIVISSGAFKAILWNLTNLESNRLPTVSQIHHQAPVLSVKISLDGRQVATGSFDRTAVLWNLVTNQAETLQDGESASHNGAVTSVDFSRDGSRIVTGSEDRKIKLWSSNGDLLNQFELEKPILSVSFSPTRNEVVAGASNGKTFLLNLTNGHSTPFLREDTGNQFPVLSVSFDQSGNEILSGYEDGTVILWSHSGAKQAVFQHRLMGRQPAVNTVSFSPNDHQILTSSDDYTAVVWNRDGSRAITLEHDAEVHSASFSRDGTQILTSSGEGTITLWSRTGDKIQQFQQPKKVQSAVLNPDSTQILTGSDDATVRRWRVYKIDELVEQGCKWLQDYITHSKNASDSDGSGCNITGL